MVQASQTMSLFSDEVFKKKEEVFKMLRTMKSLARQNIQRKLLNKFEVRSYMKLKRRFALFLKN